METVVNVYSLTRFHYFPLASYNSKDLRFQVRTAWPNFKAKTYIPDPALKNHTTAYSSLFLSLLNARRAGTSMDKIAKRLVFCSTKQADQTVLNSHVAVALKSVPSNAIIDHAGLNPEYESRALEAEAEIYGFHKTGNQNNVEFEDRLYNALDLSKSLFLLSNAAKLTFQHRVSRKHDFFKVNNPAVDNTLFKPSNTWVKSFKNRRIKFLFVGASVPRKGIHRLMSVLSRLSRSYELHLDIVGGLPKDTEMIRLFEEHKNSFSFTQVGIKPEADLPAYYQKADIFVLPSLADGWGYVTNQAQACGLPVIVSDKCGSADLVQNGNGKIFTAGDDNSLENAIIEVIGQFSDFEGVRKTRSVKKRSWADFATDYAESIRSLA
ncbi:glycosyltransferase family 4 protein [Alphaproteobacteria bacterium]|nr:glycosyltransferase family 4 protein [Alphaproteobacteria bacterium]